MTLNRRHEYDSNSFPLLSCSLLLEPHEMNTARHSFHEVFFHGRPSARFTRAVYPQTNNETGTRHSFLYRLRQKTPACGQHGTEMKTGRSGKKHAKAPRFPHRHRCCRQKQKNKRVFDIKTIITQNKFSRNHAFCLCRAGETLVKKAGNAYKNGKHEANCLCRNVQAPPGSGKEVIGHIRVRRSCERPARYRRNDTPATGKPSCKRS